MSEFNIIMPKLGESVQEATITRWLIKPGDMVEEDTSLLEIATDKVDSEIPSPVAGKVIKLLFEENAIVPVGETIAIINTEGVGESAGEVSEVQPEKKKPATEPENEPDNKKENPAGTGQLKTPPTQPADGAELERFYSPLVMNIAAKEKISGDELNNIKGTGENGRLRKQDVLNYLEKRAKQSQVQEQMQVPESRDSLENRVRTAEAPKVKIALQPGDEIVQMDRMRKLIAEHMVMSKQVSPHVTNFIEADVTGLVLWREKHKEEFQKREKVKLTFMPAFIEASAKALRDFPGVNASVDGDKIILRKNVNIGIAVALKNGNLIVPVLKNADQKNITGVAIELDRLSEAARSNSLSPDDIQNGTFTISNFGTFKNITGTPVINQPQVAILATGNIEKKPAVIETPTGDLIGIRHKMILALSYDHRIVDGALAGMFLKRLAELLEGIDLNRQL